MFPQYKALQELAGAGRIHPADLSTKDWQWRVVQVADARPAMRADTDTKSNRNRNAGADAGRDAGAARQRMSDLLAGLAASKDRLATLWQLAAAVYEAQGKGLVKADIYGKRLASRCWRTARRRRRRSVWTAGARPAVLLRAGCAQRRQRGGPRLAAQGVRTQAHVSGRLRKRAPGPLRPIAAARRANVWPLPRTCGLQWPAATTNACLDWPSSSRWWANRCKSSIPKARRSPSRCCSLRRTPCMPAARLTRARDGGGHQPALRGCVTRRPRPRPS